MLRIILKRGNSQGYFIYLSQLFSNIEKNANKSENLNTDLVAIFSAIESSTNDKL